ncbi:MAG: exodeoxyribonuclease VII large subunit, partial [Jannaschia sp.]
FGRLSRRGFPQPRRDLDRLSRRLTPAPLLRRASRDAERLTVVLRRLSVGANARQTAQVSRLTALNRMRESLGYERTLERGFAVVRDGDRVVSSTAEIPRAITIQFAGHDRIDAVTGGAARPKTVSKTLKRRPGDQGDLF